MTTRTAIAAELSMMLRDRIGCPEIPRVDVRMWPGVGSSWNLRAGHWPDEVDFGCTTEDLSEPWKTFGPRILAPVADELARLHSAHLTAHVRAGLNPYRPGKMAEVRKPRRVKSARMDLGPWSESPQRGPAAYSLGRAMQAAPFDYLGHQFDPGAISRAAGAGMQAAQPGRPYLPPEYAWMADQPKRWAWAFPAIMALLVGGAAGLIALHFLQHWNP